MNFKHQVRGGFANFPDDELLVQANTVLLAMEGNTNFPTPTPDLAEVEAARSTSTTSRYAILSSCRGAIISAM